MKIAFFSDTFLPQVNGVVTSIVEMSKELSRQGHQVLIFAPKSISFDFDQAFDDFENIKLNLVTSIDIDRLYPDQKLTLSNLNLIRSFNEFDPDIVHTHVPMSLGFQGMLLAKRYKKPLITTYHTNFTDSEALKAISWLRPALGVPLQKGLFEFLKVFFHRHDFVIAPTNDSLLELKKIKLENKSEVLPSPIDFEVLRDSSSQGLALRKKIGIKKSIIYAGRLSGEKNINQVLQVLAEINKHDPEVKFVLIGDGPSRSRLFELSFELGISSQIVWMGAYDHSQLISQGLYYLGDVFVTMSCFETQGLSTLEAMACGLPVVAANERGNKYLVDGNGALVDKGDIQSAAQSVLEILNNKEKHSQMSQKSISLAGNFKPEAVVQRLLKIYQQVISQK